MSLLRDFQREILQQHFASRNDLSRDEVGDLVPIDVLLAATAAAALLVLAFDLHAYCYQLSDAEGIFEHDTAEIAEICQTDLVEVFIADHPVVD